MEWEGYMIRLECKNCTKSGWCEYDLITDTIYPSDGGECQEKSSEEESE